MLASEGIGLERSGGVKGWMGSRAWDPLRTWTVGLCDARGLGISIFIGYDMAHSSPSRELGRDIRGFFLDDGGVRA